jgi:hypothetical protein
MESKTDNLWLTLLNALPCLISSRFDDDLPIFGEIMPATVAKIVEIRFKELRIAAVNL